MAAPFPGDCQSHAATVVDVARATVPCNVMEKVDSLRAYIVEPEVSDHVKDTTDGKLVITS